MKILQVVDNYPPAVGGLERYVQSLSVALARRGHEVRVATLARGEPDVRADEQCPQVAVHRLDWTLRRLTGRSPATDHVFHQPAPDPLFTRGLRRLVADFGPDVVNSHSWSWHSVAAVRGAAGFRHVHSLHDYSLVCAKQTYTREATGCADGPALRRCISCAAQVYGTPKATMTVTALRSSRRQGRSVDRFLAVSDAVASRNAVGTVGRPVDVVPGFVPDDVAEVDTTALPPDVPRVPFALFVGALGPHKGLDVLLRARRLQPDPLPLVVCGSPRPDTPDLDQPGVSVLPNLPHGQVMQLWRRAMFGVIPSVWPEPFGLVAVEALAAGCPLVVSDAGGLPEIVRRGQDALLVRPGDERALADAMTRVAGDAALRQDLSGRGPIRAREFIESAVVPRILNVYEAALAGTSRRVT